jgi:hypothetical protein
MGLMVVNSGALKIRPAREVRLVISKSDQDAFVAASDADQKMVIELTRTSGDPFALLLMGAAAKRTMVTLIGERVEDAPEPIELLVDFRDGTLSLAPFSAVDAELVGARSTGSAPSWIRRQLKKGVTIRIRTDLPVIH